MDGWSIARGFVVNPVIAIISVSVIPMSLKASHVWPPSVATIYRSCSGSDVHLSGTLGTRQV